MVRKRPCVRFTLWAPLTKLKMRIPKTIKISRCRLCFNKNLSKIYSFGNLFISNFVLKKILTKVLKGDATKAKRIIRYKLKTKIHDLIKIMMDSELKKYNG